MVGGGGAPTRPAPLEAAEGASAGSASASSGERAVIGVLAALRQQEEAAPEAVHEDPAGRRGAKLRAGRAAQSERLRALMAAMGATFR